MSGQVHLACGTQGVGILTAVVVRHEIREVIPPRVLRVEVHRAGRNLQPTLVLPHVSEQGAQHGRSARVAGVECHRTVDRIDEAVAVVLEEAGDRQRLPRVLVGGLEIERTRDRLPCAA